MEWNLSTCIHSLLNYPSIRADWHAIIRQSVGGDNYNTGQLQWSDSNIKLLREDLEWDHTGRQAGSTLAMKAHDLLNVSDSHISPANSSSLPKFLDHVHLSQPSVGPNSKGFKQAMSNQVLEQLPFSPLNNGSSYNSTFSTQQCKVSPYVDTTLTSFSFCAPMSNPENGLGASLIQTPFNEDIPFENLDWDDSSLATNCFDSRAEHGAFGHEDSFDWSK